MMPPLRGSVPDREPGTDEGAVLHSVDDRDGVVADRDAALAALVDEGGVAGFGTVAAGLVPRHQVHRGCADIRPDAGSAASTLLRFSAVTWCPLAVASWVTALPRWPGAPMTAIFMAGFFLLGRLSRSCRATRRSSGRSRGGSPPEVPTRPGRLPPGHPLLVLPPPPAHPAP